MTNPWPATESTDSDIAGIDAATLAEVGLLVRVQGQVVTITLNRPEVRNAQTPAMWRALAGIGRSLGATEQVRVVVVRGSGQSFSAGLDTSMLDPSAMDGRSETIVGLLAGSDEQLIATIGEYQQGFAFLRDPRFVSIAVVQGHAIGAGFQLALACDLRILADNAQLCMKEAALGLVPDLTGTSSLVDCVGYSRALEICVTARSLDAAEARAIGLATAVVPVDDVDSAAEQLIEALTALPVGAVREIKALLQGAGNRSADEQYRAERTAQSRRLRALAAQFDR